VINWRAAVVLVAVLIGLGVYAFQTRPQPPAPAKPSPALFPCDTTETIDLRLTGLAGKAMAVHRSSPSEDWQLTQPGPGPADNAAVNDLLATAYQLRASASQAAVPNMSALGLDPPQLTATCGLRKGASYTLTVGGQNFDGSGTYARVSGDARVHVIPSAAVKKFEKALAQPPVRPSPTPTGSPSPSPSA
jgi:hypothetical protein